VTFISSRPGFDTVLDDRAIEAILDYIKPTWPERSREVQPERSRAVSGD
jgi:mono/diheme cytochrome c family protein